MIGATKSFPLTDGWQGLYNHGIGIGEAWSLCKVSPTVYLTVMLGVIALACVVSIPSLFRKKCRKCGARNGIEACVCIQCGAPFPEDE